MFKNNDSDDNNHDNDNDNDNINYNSNNMSITYIYIYIYLFIYLSNIYIYIYACAGFYLLRTDKKTSKSWWNNHSLSKNLGSFFRPWDMASIVNAPGWAAAHGQICLSVCHPISWWV